MQIELTSAQQQASELLISRQSPRGYEEVIQTAEKDYVEQWRKRRWKHGVLCVGCGSNQVQPRTKKYRGSIIRYHCKECGKWFDDFTGTPLAGKKLLKFSPGLTGIGLVYWYATASLLKKGWSIHKIAKKFGRSHQAIKSIADTLPHLPFEEWIDTGRKKSEHTYTTSIKVDLTFSAEVVERRNAKGWTREHS